jgi:hypothetical protein
VARQVDCNKSPIRHWHVCASCVPGRNVVRAVPFPSPQPSPPGRGGSDGAGLQRGADPSNRHPLLLPSPWGEGPRVRETEALEYPFVLVLLSGIEVRIRLLASIGGHPNHRHFAVPCSSVSICVYLRLKMLRCLPRLLVVSRARPRPGRTCPVRRPMSSPL